jgi:predicted porin
VDTSAGAEFGTARTMVLNVEYSLSKRTLVYAVFDRKQSDGGLLTGAVGTVDDGATGIGVGITHNF